MRAVALGVTLALTLAAPASADAPKARRAPGALVLAIDRSLTMQGPGLAAMKAAALASIAALAPDDQVAVVAFDSEAAIVAPLQRAGSRARIARALQALRSEGGTNLYTGRITISWIRQRARACAARSSLPWADMPWRSPLHTRLRCSRTPWLARASTPA
ncbi:MAG TPA: VWA domain-containing protein [Kofleriaceae bacterium]|nr:VWA domain-containing protein [Kofleriaceae bacterium]